jgi:hypothetical protein
MMARRGVNFRCFLRRTSQTSPPVSAGGFFVPDPEQGGRTASMIEFILIVVLLLVLIGIFVRREVFKW